LYDGKILTESGLITQFLVDSHPSHLVKTSSEKGGALQRFDIGFFVDAYFSKVHPNVHPATVALGEEKDALVAKYTAAIVKEIEPLLANAAPFFGGSERITLAEVWTAVLRTLKHYIPSHC
jgi:glutathione S-transferase